MCTNYAAARRATFAKYFGVEPPTTEWPDEIYQDYLAPIVRPGAGAREAVTATFGMVPKGKLPQGKHYSTMNARAETVGEKPTYRGAWAKAQRCLIAVDAVYEPNWETGKHIRYRIGLASGEPFALAGLWRAWPGPEGEAISFTMLTVNADSHPLMRRMHKPGDEKRSVVIVRPDDYDEWLNASDPEVARSMLTLYSAERMAAEPAPKPPRAAAVIEDV
ncbi:SOS response-associated peptidase [Trinickia mobilis]|uniref:SOS response-associated peptidase n=1 Tax=Trinickia mobilis TaxID=2816356 RepID=UPI001A901D78|nr:SOS response-associated peptidase family protein [Trinickia mobilis]